MLIIKIKKEYLPGRVLGNMILLLFHYLKNSAPHSSCTALSIFQIFLPSIFQYYSKNQTKCPRLTASSPMTSSYLNFFFGMNLFSPMAMSPFISSPLIEKTYFEDFFLIFLLLFIREEEDFSLPIWDR